MIKTDAFWEKRNIGLNVLEIEFEGDDGIQSVRDAVKEFDGYDYVIAKVPKRKINIVHYLEQLKFNFIEAQAYLYNNLNRNFPMDNYIRKISDEIKLKRISCEDGLNSVISRIDERMFDTDRVSLDPILGCKYARKRYVNWLQDEYSSGNAVIVEILYNAASIGFFLLRMIGTDTCYAVLAGLYSEYKNSGLGFCTIERPIAWCRENNFKKLVARASTNNLESLRLHVNFGYEIKNIHYVLRRKF